jgi:hypothetical protein
VAHASDSNIFQVPDGALVLGVIGDEEKPSFYLFLEDEAESSTPFTFVVVEPARTIKAESGLLLGIKIGQLWDEGELDLHEADVALMVATLASLTAEKWAREESEETK